MNFNFNNQIKVESINANEFDKLKSQNYKIIDVRTLVEHSEARIDNSILADIYSSDFKNKIDKLNKDNSYLVYCRSGNRSRIACEIMMKWGFKKVINLSGGIISWINTGKDIVR